MLACLVELCLGKAAKGEEVSGRPGVSAPAELEDWWRADCELHRASGVVSERGGSEAGPVSKARRAQLAAAL